MWLGRAQAQNREIIKQSFKNSFDAHKQSAISNKDISS